VDRLDATVDRLHAAEVSATDAADAAADALIAACVAEGARQGWAEAIVGDLGAAIAERSSWATAADRARHDSEEIAPLRAEIALWAAPAPLAAYERAVADEQAAIAALAVALRAHSTASARADLLGAVDEAHRALVAGWLDHAHPDLTGVRASGARIEEAFAAAEERGQTYAGTPDQIAASAELRRALDAITATHAALIALLTALGVAEARAGVLVHLYAVSVGDDYRPGD